MDERCPACDRPLYDRTRATCGYCGAQVPEALRFTPGEGLAHRTELNRLVAERQAWLEAERVEREEAARKAAAAAVLSSIPTFIR